MDGARPRDTVTMEWMPTRLDIDHLRTRFYDPASAAPAPKLADVTAERPESPRIGEVRENIDARLKEGDSLAEAFNALPDDLRRPVELFGLAYLASHGEIEAPEDGIVQTVRPDGSTRAFTFPKMTGDPHE